MAGPETAMRTVRVAAGVDVPYPEPSSAAATAIGKANRRSDTKAEVALRSALHRRGMRFRKDLLVRAPTGKARVDICFTRARVAVFVDGCFWHVCPVHHHPPRRNTGYWAPKLRANLERDNRNNLALQADGWEVLRIWEHENLADAVDKVEGALARAREER